MMPLFDNIPAELKVLSQWVAVNADKVPINPHVGFPADPTDPAAWGTFTEAVACNAAFGIGFCLTRNDPYCIIDLDDKIDNAVSKDEFAEYKAIIEYFDSYTERSISKRNGFHIVIKGEVPQGRKRNKKEIYSSSRMMIFTGDVVNNKPIKECQDKLTEFYNITFNRRQKDVTLSNEAQTEDDSVIWERACNAHNKDKFILLCQGKWKNNYDSQSEADHALLSMLCFYTKNNEQAKRMFRQTELGKREKAQREDYLDRSIERLRAPEIDFTEFKKNMKLPDRWPSPQLLTAKIAPDTYPIDALPDTIRAAVEEVAGFVKAPLPLVASSALAAVSLACQAHIDVKRTEGLHGPVALYLLTIADSGERKSTCDGFFTQPIRDYEAAQAEAAKPIVDNYRAAIEAWDAKRSGIKEQIRQLAKGNKPTADAEKALRDLEQAKPQPPRFPRLLYTDATPEALAYGLAKQWPSGGMISAEAGIVFGSHGMGRDSVMRNLSLLNQLWDGTSLTIDRRSTDSYTVRGARLTVALQVQEPTLREFFTRSGELARGTGFLARFLVAWPQSTQGYRLFVEAPTNWPCLAAFHQRVAEILDQPVSINEDGVLSLTMLLLTPEAKKEWVAFHDAIERELANGGQFYDVRDVASKSADNAVRLAALLQQFEHGTDGAISANNFKRASRIAAWHLSESRRFFGELALPAELVDATRLDNWLIKHCRDKHSNSVEKNHVRQHGPLRDKARLDAAISELANLDCLRLEKDSKPQMIHLNPALTGATP